MRLCPARFLRDTASNGVAGAAGQDGLGIGGGLFLDPAGLATLANTTIADNQATNVDNDVHGTFKTTV